MRTKVDDIPLEVLDELVPFERHDTYIASVAAGVGVIGDLRCPVDPGDDTIEGIAPGGLEELEELIEDTNVRPRFLQLLLLILQVPVVLRILLLGLICHQLRKLLGEQLGVIELLSKQGTSLVEELLKATMTAIANVLLTFTLVATVLVVLVGLLGHDMFIGKRQDVLALIAMSVLTTVEVKTE